MSHSVNMGLEKLIATGYRVGIRDVSHAVVSGTVELLKRNPEVSVGIHLTLNSEWKNYRGPRARPYRGANAC